MKRKNISCYVHIDSWYYKTPDIQLPPNQTFLLVIDYPLFVIKPVNFKIKTGKHGLGFAGLVNKIVRIYNKIYKNPDRYGVFGHGIEDLSLGRISVDFTKQKIYLGVGS